MGGELCDADMGDVGFLNCSTSLLACEAAHEPDSGQYIPDPSGSFLLKQLSIMRRFSSSNRSALEATVPPFARSIWEPGADHEGEAREGRSCIVERIERAR